MCIAAGRRHRSGKVFSAFSLKGFEFLQVKTSIHGVAAESGLDTPETLQEESDMEAELSDLTDLEDDDNDDNEPVKPPPNPPRATPSHSAETTTRKASKIRANLRSHARRNVRRQSNSTAKPHLEKRRKEALKAAVSTEAKAPEFEASSSGYQGKKDFPPAQRLSRADAEERGIELVEWHGQSYAIVDQDFQLIGLVLAPPSDEDGRSYEKEVIQPIFEHMQATAEQLRAAKARARARASKKLKRAPTQEVTPRRGRFLSETVGVSFGGGQEHPMNNVHRGAKRIILENLVQQPALRRHNGHINSGFRTHFSDLANEYRRMQEALHTSNPDLRKVYENSVFSATTFNFGPQTVCDEHRDWKNRAVGQCAISAFGEYDWKKGGHLIAWTLGLMFEFPPGVTIFLPSALITHSNTAIAEHEVRYSITQYSAAGLFRWVDNGFHSDVEFLATASPEAEAAWKAARRTKFMDDLRFFPTVSPSDAP